jgi:transmembrane protein 8A/B
MAQENFTKILFFSSFSRFEIHTLHFQSDGSTVRLNIDGPQPGNWFGIAYISWTDPNNERIEQQGMMKTKLM